MLLGPAAGERTKPQRIAANVDYSSEAALVDHFACCLRAGHTRWGKAKIAFEFGYGGGYADVLVLAHGEDVIAFEAKLVKWRDALHQAYRTLCFAHRAFVVLPEKAARVALRHEGEFRRRRVGLCSVCPVSGVDVLLDAEWGAPLQPWIQSRARAVLAA